jgi:hypothetical protein
MACAKRGRSTPQMASKYAKRGRPTPQMAKYAKRGPLPDFVSILGGWFPTCPHHYGCFWYGTKLPWGPQAARALQQLRHFDSLA